MRFFLFVVFCLLPLISGFKISGKLLQVGGIRVNEKLPMDYYTNIWNQKYLSEKYGDSVRFYDVNAQRECSKILLVKVTRMASKLPYKKSGHQDMRERREVRYVKYDVKMSEYMWDGKRMKHWNEVSNAVDEFFRQGGEVV